MLYSAFMIGLAGSLHCMGMCGPVSMLLPADKSKRGRYILGRIIYNLGRIFTYSLLGLLIGLVGEQIALFTSQKVLFIIVGSLILLAFILPARWRQSLDVLPYTSRFTSFIKSALSVFYKKHTLFAQLVFGVLNGLLPCGLVYAALSGAFLMSEAWESALFMALFGLGTLPMMLGFAFLGNSIRKLIRFQPKVVYTFSYIILAFWLIFKGINLPANQFSERDVNGITVCHGK
ncbi:sulfite exporter TauE/SafE family protein [Emticicia sp. BO119]|uniref:sulfite exporter TauE/SafE family protein n=1 Tax=Emticicia sp. BO119 TaxID=2757768 RepID=UPI0015F04BBA|nr:sulfite exporter TauE/SafE family protein [Emticicia sp. BO119]MBA4848900.1 sulfite exporter TauE/SafE family protein [Emticicia sp. BO119]